MHLPYHVHRIKIKMKICTLVLIKIKIIISIIVNPLIESSSSIFATFEPSNLVQY